MTQPTTTTERSIHALRTVEEGVRDVARLREGVGTLKDVLRERDRAYAESTAEMHRIIAIQSKDLQTAEDALRWLALKRYEQTGEKEVAVGVKIRMETSVGYEVAKAIQWAQQHEEGTAYLKLDAKKFNSAARALDFPFVEKDTIPVAVISRDLSPVLEAS